MPSQRRPHADLTERERAAIAGYLMAKSTDLKLEHGVLEGAAIKFNCSARTVKRLWQQVASSIATTDSLPDFSVTGHGKRSRKKKVTDISDRIRLVPWRRRGNLPSLAAALGIPKTTVWRALSEGEIVRHSNSVKLFLSDSNKREHLAFCISFVNPNTMKFQEQDTRIHIDEKWFYLTRPEQTYYMAPGGEPPTRSVQSKRYITKVMLLAAVMRPIIEDGVVVFDRKIGIWPFVVEEEAKRASKKRSVGTVEMNPIIVDKVEHREMMMECVIPAIKAKVPERMREQRLVIQQDGARTHILEDDPVVMAACAKGGWSIRVCKQPPNSPDLNVLDLGFFCSIQALQHEFAPSSIQELVECTEQAFADLKPTKLDDTFLSLQQAMERVIKDFGGNAYKRPHMSKEKLRKQGLLPKDLNCCETAYLAGQAYQFLTFSED